MKPAFETRKTVHNEIITEQTGGCEIYFRLPLSGYFVGRDIDFNDEKSPLYLYRKEFDGYGYYFAKV